ncbi:MAG: ELM1/GtrOC1 family putative glycosyltransferase, partial [Pseudomonadota bacterium]
MRLLVVTDGRPANLTQALGLAEAMADHIPIQIPVQIPFQIACAEVSLRPGFDRVPSRLLALLGRWAFRGLPAGVPDLVLGAGRRGNLAAHALAQQGARAVAVLDPQLPLSRFAAIVLPSHDRRAREGPAHYGSHQGSHQGGAGAVVLTTLGAMNRLSPQVLADAPRP